MSVSRESGERPESGARGDAPDAGPAPATTSHAAPARPSRLYRFVWLMHRAYHRLTRRGLSRPSPDRWGTLGLRTIGRHSGRERDVLLGYYEDGTSLVLLAVNGWADPEPAWWLNLQAHPDAVVDLPRGSRAVRARAAEGQERARLWARWRDLGARSGDADMADLDEKAARLSRQAAVVVLEAPPARN